MASSGLLLTGCVQRACLNTAIQSPLHPAAQGETNTVYGTSQASLIALSEDYAAVIAGHGPKHAKFDRQAPTPADGGTTYYHGDGYQLVVVQSFCRVGGLEGYMYGPIITLSNRLVVGNTDNISHVVFYSVEEFARLRGDKRNQDLRK